MHAQEAGESHTRFDIQGLRAVAVLIVIVAHCKLFDIYGGVDVFFVISGFIITSALLREQLRTGKISFLKFYARRAKRLLPVATVAILVTVGAAWWFASPLKLNATAIDGLFAALFTLNWRLALQGTDYFADRSAGAFQHFWSLSVEEQYYFCWPLLLVVFVWLARKMSIPRKVMLGGLLSLIITLSFTLSIIITHTNQPLAYFGFHTRAWELAVGALVAVGAEWFARMKTWVAAGVSWVGLATILVTGVLINADTPLPGYALAGSVAGAALVIMGGCAHPAQGAEWLLKRKPLTFMGDVSYGWYLWHWPLLILWPDVVGRELTIVDGIRVAVISLGIATITYYLIETPFRRMAVRPSFNLPIGVATVGLSALTLVGVSMLPVRVASGDNIQPATINTEARALLESATQLRELPGNLQPPLNKVADDKPAHACIGDWQSTKPLDFDKCAMGDRSSKSTVVMFGDSHSWQWASAFDRIGKQKRWKVVSVVKGGCSAGRYDIISPNLGRLYTECNQWREAAIQKIVKLRPTMVVMSGQTRREATREGMGATVRRLTNINVRKGLNTKVVFLADTPYPDRNVPDCLARHARDIQRCTVPITSAMSLPDQRALEKEVAQAHKVPVVDMTEWFCTDKVCPSVIGGRAVYFDYSHITKTYALWLSPRLASALTRAVA